MNMKKFYSRITGATAILMTIMYMILVSNEIFNYITSIHIIKILTEGIYYGGFTLLVVSTLSTVAYSSWITKTIFSLAWVIIICYSISPTLFGLIA